jgi:hypothetical protein
VADVFIMDMIRLLGSILVTSIFFFGMKDAIDTSERVAHGETNQAQAVQPMTSLQQSFNPSK